MDAALKVCPWRMMGKVSLDRVVKVLRTIPCVVHEGAFGGGFFAVGVAHDDVDHVAILPRKGFHFERR